MGHRLLLGSLRNDTAPLEEVRALLLDLKGAWEQIASNPLPRLPIPVPMPAVPRLNS